LKLYIIILFFILISLTLVKKKRENNKFLYFFLGVIFILIAGLRPELSSIDYSNYLNAYNSLKGFGNNRSEPSFQFIVIIVKQIFNNPKYYIPNRLFYYKNLLSKNDIPPQTILEETDLILVDYEGIVFQTKYNIDYYRRYLEEFFERNILYNNIIEYKNKYVKNSILIEENKYYKNYENKLSKNNLEIKINNRQKNSINSKEKTIHGFYMKIEQIIFNIQTIDIIIYYFYSEWTEQAQISKFSIFNTDDIITSFLRENINFNENFILVGKFVSLIPNTYFQYFYDIRNFPELTEIIYVDDPDNYNFEPDGYFHYNKNTKEYELDIQKIEFFSRIFQNSKFINNNIKIQKEKNIFLNIENEKKKKKIHRSYSNFIIIVTN